MNKSRPVFFYELCRLCLDNEGVCDVFDTDDLLQDIYACTGVIMYPSDNLPHKVCIKCTEIIRNAKAFRIFVNKNDVYLRSMFKSDAGVDIIKTIACHTPKEISTPEKSSEEVQSVYFQNGNKDGDNQNKADLKTRSEDENMFEAGPVVVQAISLRKDLFYSSTSPTATLKPESQSEGDPHVELLEQKVKLEHTCNKCIKKDKNEDIDYVCGICSKEFKTRKKFYHHQRLHNKNLPCPLKYCGKKFASKGDLDKHVRIHTGEKPFVCGFCKKAFAQRVSLRQHVESLHPKDTSKVESDSVPNTEESCS